MLRPRLQPRFSVFLIACSLISGLVSSGCEPDINVAGETELRVYEANARTCGCDYGAATCEMDWQKRQDISRCYSTAYDARFSPALETFYACASAVAQAYLDCVNASVCDDLERCNEIIGSEPNSLNGFFGACPAPGDDELRNFYRVAERCISAGVTPAETCIAPHDLGSATGSVIWRASTYGSLPALGRLSCPSDPFSPLYASTAQRLVTWIAPRSGRFRLTAVGAGVLTAMVLSSCSETADVLACGAVSPIFAGGEDRSLVFEASQDQRLTIVLGTWGTGDRFTLGIEHVE